MLRRKSKNYPPHIDPDKLPTNVEYDPRGSGRWKYRVSRGRKDRGKPYRFGDSATTLAEIWQHVEKLQTDSVETFRGISLKFQDSEDWAELAPRTRKGYAHNHKMVCDWEMNSGGKLGDAPIEAWTPGAVRKYQSKRGAQSKSAAAAEIRYIKRVFSWAISMDYYLGTNPAKGVTIKAPKARTHYVQDYDYNLAIAVAPLRVGLAAHIAYLTGRRRTDILDLRRTQLTLDGIEFSDEAAGDESGDEHKTGKITLVEWSDELRATVELAKSLAGASIFLFPDKESPAERYSDSAFDTAWQRVRQSVRKAGGAPCQFKDLRAKHSSDFESEEDATYNLRHSDGAVTRRHYRRRPTRVRSIR